MEVCNHLARGCSRAKDEAKAKEEGGGRCSLGTRVKDSTTAVTVAEDKEAPAVVVAAAGMEMAVTASATCCRA